MKRFFSVLLLSAVFLVACDTERMNQESTSSKNAVSISEIKFHPIGGTAEFSITSANAWSIEHSLPSWISVSPQNGNPGTTTVTLSAGMAQWDYNDYIRVESHVGDLAEVKVYQEEPKLSVVAKVNNQEVSTDGIILSWGLEEKINIIVESNTDWDIMPDGVSLSYGSDGDGVMNGWLQCSRLSGTVADSGKKIELQPITYNLDSNDRDVAFRLVGPSDEYTFYIAQGHKKLLANSSDGSAISFAPCNSNITTLNIDSDFDRWEITTLPSWISTDVFGGDRGAYSVDLSAQINYERASLNENIVITGHVIEDGVEKTAIREVPVELRPYVLETSHISYTLEALSGKNFTTSLRSSGKWAITNLPSWLEANIASGDGMEYKADRTEADDVTLYAKSTNFDMNNSKRVDIIFHSEEGNNLSHTISVTQDKYMFAASASESELGTFDTDKKTMSISCSGNWKLSSNASWLKVDSSTGTGNTTVYYNATSVNESSSNRTGTITMTSTNHDNAGISYTPIAINVTQQKLTWSISPASGTTYTFSPIDTSKKVISINSSIDWYVESNYSWITTSKDNGGIGNNSIQVGVTDNYQLTSRAGSFKIKSTKGNKSHTINVNQTAFVYDTSVASVSFEGIDPGEKKVAIGQCLGSWTIEAPEWLTVSPMSGSGSATVTITPKEHITADSNVSARSDKVLVKSQYYSQNNKLVKNINVTQKVYIFNVSTTSVSVEASKAANVDVVCSGKWTASCGESWIEISPTSGDGNGTLKITAKSKNSGSQERKAAVTVKSGSHEKTITVTQAAGK